MFKAIFIALIAVFLVGALLLSSSVLLLMRKFMLLFRNNDNKKPTHTDSELMIKCHQCGTYILKSNAKTLQNGLYICKEHESND